MFENIGSYKLVDINSEDFTGKLKQITYKNNNLKPLTNEKLNLINIGSEYDPDFEQIYKYTCIIIKGETAGTDKTELCLKYAIKLGKKFVIVVPQNKNIDDIRKRIIKLSNNNEQLNFDIMTFHHFFNMDNNGNKLNNKIHLN